MKVPKCVDDEMGNQTSQLIEELAESTNFTREDIQKMALRFKKLDKDGNGSTCRTKQKNIPLRNLSHIHNNASFLCQPTHPPPSQQTN